MVPELQDLPVESFVHETEEVKPDLKISAKPQQDHEVLVSQPQVNPFEHDPEISAKPKHELVKMPKHQQEHEVLVPHAQLVDPFEFTDDEDEDDDIGDYMSPIKSCLQILDDNLMTSEATTPAEEENDAIAPTSDITDNPQSTPISHQSGVKKRRISIQNDATPIRNVDSSPESKQPPKKKARRGSVKKARTKSRERPPSSHQRRSVTGLFLGRPKKAKIAKLEHLEPMLPAAIALPEPTTETTAAELITDIDNANTGW